MWCCGSVIYVRFKYSVVVWQRDLSLVCVLCGGLAACYRYVVCTVWWCGSVSYV